MDTRKRQIEDDNSIEETKKRRTGEISECCLRTLERFQKQFQIELTNYTTTFLQQSWEYSRSPSFFHHLPRLLSYQQTETIVEESRKRKAKVTDNQLRCKMKRIGDNDFNVKSEMEPINLHHSIQYNAILTSSHLRKAKLMFLYSRYPTSVTIKECFPDVQFTKSNTSQLIKWFSNFREFFYIQVEKYARNNLSKDEDISLFDLYRNLTNHYDRSELNETPTNFINAIDTAIKEFKNTIKTGKDKEPSWKKGIYKIISKLDVPIPQYLKNSENFWPTR